MPDRGAGANDVFMIPISEVVGALDLIEAMKEIRELWEEAMQALQQTMVGRAAKKPKEFESSSPMNLIRSLLSR